MMRRSAEKKISVVRRNKMSKLQHNVWLRSVKLLAVLCMTLPFAACWYGYYTFHVAMPLGWSGKLVVGAAVCGPVYSTGKCIRSISDFIAKNSINRFQPNAGGYDCRRFDLSSHLPAGKKILQPYTRNCRHSRAVGGVGFMGFLCTEMVL